MARLRYIADNPRGPRGGHNDVRTLFSCASSAWRNTRPVDDGKYHGRVLVADLDALLVLDQIDPLTGIVKENANVTLDNLYAWHESRWQHHGSEVLRLRELVEAGKAPAYLTTHDLGQLREATVEFVEDRARFPERKQPWPERRVFFLLRDLLREGKLGGPPR